MKQKKVAMVIGAGGVQCAAALGALWALRQAGIGLDLVVGCSDGALYATAVALGMDAEATISLARRLWTHELTGRRDYRGLLGALFPKRMEFDGRFGLRDDALLLKRLNEAFAEQTFAGAQIPLLLTATDFITGEQVILQDGRLSDALRASMAMPFVFAPWRINGRLLTDGYLSDPLPVNVAGREGADVIIALGFEMPYQSKIDSPLRYAFQLSGIMTNSTFRARLAFQHLAHHAELLLLTPQFRRRIDRFDTEKLPAIVAAGEEAMRAQLPDLQTVNGDR